MDEQESIRLGGNKKTLNNEVVIVQKATKEKEATSLLTKKKIPIGGWGVLGRTTIQQRMINIPKRKYEKKIRPPI